MKQAVIIGASGGIGGALTQTLANSGDYRILGTFCDHTPTWTHETVTWRHLDVLSADSLHACFKDIVCIDLLVNTIGQLATGEFKPEKSLAQFSSEQLMAAISMNTAPLLNLAKQAMPGLKQGTNPKVVTLSARVGSISDNQLGGWYSYRCSKAALNMAVKTIAIEWARTLPRAALIAYHPGTVKTALSAPFTARVRPENLFTPEAAADYLMAVIATLTPEQSGTFWDWQGQTIPW